MLNTSVMLLGATLLSFGQSTTPKTAPAPKPDTWERSKECAAQASALMATRDFGIGPDASSVAQWQNHYSAKYNACFLRIFYSAVGKDRLRGAPIAYVVLIDAIERWELAESARGLPPVEACRNEANRAECEEVARAMYAVCSIESKQASCVESDNFISEHMKN